MGAMNCVPSIPSGVVKRSFIGYTSEEPNMDGQPSDLHRLSLYL